ncbi:MAG: metallophosphoesterase, partial [Myxococcota bacterium]
MGLPEPWSMDVAGLLCIGDPHLASRNPGFRCDDYPHTVLDKLRWCLALARDQGLLPVLLGDLFHWPRENANWLLSALMEMLADQLVLAIPGNHDCHEDALTEHDSLTVLARADRVVLIDRDGPWLGTVGGWPVVVGGTAWGQQLPEQVVRPRFLPQPDRAPTVIWITHHDVVFSGPELPQYVVPRSIDGVDLVVNGHIHIREPDRVCGHTTWINPGNISRVSRDEVIQAKPPLLGSMSSLSTAGVWAW